MSLGSHSSLREVQGLLSCLFSKLGGSRDILVGISTGNTNAASCYSGLMLTFERYSRFITRASFHLFQQALQSDGETFIPSGYPAPANPERWNETGRRLIRRFGGEKQIWQQSDWIYNSPSCSHHSRSPADWASRSQVWRLPTRQASWWLPRARTHVTSVSGRWKVWALQARANV